MMSNLFSKYYYYLSVILRYPVFKYNLYKISYYLKSDWFDKTNYHKDFQKRNFNRLIKWALKTKFYKSFFNLTENEIPNFKDFPVLSKVDLRKAENDIRNNFFLNPRNKSNTGGSSGTPFHFYISPNLRDFEFSHQKFFFDRLGYKKKDLIYSLDGTRISKNNKEKSIYWKTKVGSGFPYGKVHLSVLELNKNTYDIYIEKILKDKPTFLRGYPSALESLALFVKKTKKSNKFDFIKGILLTSENITEDQVKNIGTIFNTNVYPQYGMTEACAFGFTKANSLKYYCSPFYGITEVLDDNNEHVKLGEVGKVVLTSLGNYYQPFIRYSTGDLAEYGGFDNGFVILNKIVGRTQDFIVDKNGRIIMLVGLIFGAHLQAFKAIITWQIKQDIPGFISIIIDKDDSVWKEEFELEILSTLSCNKKVSVEITYGSDFIFTKSGKRLFLIQNIKKSDENNL